MLPVKRQRLAVLVHHQIDDQLVGEQRLGHDAFRRRRRAHTLLRALYAGSLSTLDHGDEVFGRTYVEHFGLLITDHLRLSAALSALACRARAGNHLLNARKMAG